MMSRRQITLGTTSSGQSNVLVLISIFLSMSWWKDTQREIREDEWQRFWFGSGSTCPTSRFFTLFLYVKTMVISESKTHLVLPVTHFSPVTHPAGATKINRRRMWFWKTKGSLEQKWVMNLNKQPADACVILRKPRQQCHLLVKPIPYDPLWVRALAAGG